MKKITTEIMANGTMSEVKVVADTLSDFISALQEIENIFGNIKVVSKYDGNIFPAEANIYIFSDGAMHLTIGSDT